MRNPSFSLGYGRAGVAQVEAPNVVACVALALWPGAPGAPEFWLMRKVETAVSSVPLPA